MWTKVHDILERRSRRLVVINALDRLSISFLFQRYNLLKLPLSCEVGPKMVFFGPQFVGGGDSQVLDMHFQITVIFEHFADFG